MAKKNLRKGLFITFEGPEGSGKSTHSGLVASLLKKEGYDIVYTREPGGTRTGDRIRNILLNLKKLDISPLTEVLLFEASRSALVQEIIKPSLEEKKIVICDRFNDATLVYQGYAGNVPLKDIQKIESVSMQGIKPDLTIVLDIDAKKGLGKTKRQKRDRMESKALSFHKRVRSGYLSLARQEKQRIKVIKTEDTIDRTFKRVKIEVANVIRRYKRSG